MKSLICGSKALRHWLGDSHWRVISDTDTLGYFVDADLTGYKEEASNFIYTNFKERKEFINVSLCEPLRKLLERNVDDTYLDLRSCLIMKNAHKHFYLGKYKKSFKHLLDYSHLLDHIELTEEETQLSLEYRQWLIQYVYNNDRRLLHFPKLNKTKEQFFNDHVTYYVDHDLIHEKVAIEDKPAYTYCLTGEVMFSNKLFNQLDFDKKVNMVLEESFVLALERAIIPMFNGETYLPAVTPDEAFKYALVRVATNITSGDFRDFAADNFYKIYKTYTDNHTKYYKVIDDLLGEI